MSDAHPGIEFELTEKIVAKRGDEVTDTETTLRFKTDEFVIWDIPVEPLINRVFDVEPNPSRELPADAPVEAPAEAQGDCNGQSPAPNPNEIGPVPAPVNPVRKRACALEFVKFCQAYLPDWFTRDLDHSAQLVFIALGKAVLDGGRHTVEPIRRGGGTTTMVMAAALWSALYKHRRRVRIFFPEPCEAEAVIENIHYELAHNETLLNDFPDACIPFRVAAGLAPRLELQTTDGFPLKASRTSRMIRFPDALDTGHVQSEIHAAGVKSHIGGLRYHTDIVFIDGHYTVEDLESPARKKKTDRALAGIRYLFDHVPLVDIG